jgi:MFS family permease
MRAPPGRGRPAGPSRDTAPIAGSVRSRASLIAALCLSVSVAYGALFYGFSVLIGDAAAGAEFSTSVLSAAYGGAVLTGGLAAVPVGRLADRHGVRRLIAAGALLGAVGLLGFAAARDGWQVLLCWWALIGPATAMTFYEPAYIAIQQAFAPAARPRAIAVLTLTAGLSGPVFTPLTGALVDGVVWRDATRLLAVPLACAAPLALRFVAVHPAPTRPATDASREPRRAARANLVSLRPAHLLLFTAGAVLGYGAIEAIVVHRVARFEELGFGLGTVTLWAGISGLLTLPGRFALPLLARRMRATTVLAFVLAVLAVSAALMIGGSAYWQLVASFVLFGLVFGAALPLRAVVMGDWTATAVFGRVMGVQAALIALGRAGAPALTGALHDAFDGYGVAVALLAGMLTAASMLVLWSGRRDAARRSPSRSERTRAPASHCP